ncbi:hypothetical protein EYF80_023534 [Liparis tanakae]|uniref:Uncharacterized protein n=1 Tax=Liparis tanakae TaxID=230148 RepID=A0A4Z2HLM6_9TELE|nr:hypothetical protein EYF80_023534 [Liparis tanakae]
MDKQEQKEADVDREINSSKRQLRPMSTRGELQAEHVVQITKHLRSGGWGGGQGGLDFGKLLARDRERAGRGAEEHVGRDENVFYWSLDKYRPPLPPPLPPAAFQLSLASVSSPRSLSFCKTEVLGLDDGVPIKVILDVISWHAMHLEVSGRYHVLLVHLCMVSWGGNGGK